MSKKEQFAIYARDMNHHGIACLRIGYAEKARACFERRDRYIAKARGEA